MKPWKPWATTIPSLNMSVPAVELETVAEEKRASSMEFAVAEKKTTPQKGASVVQLNEDGEGTERIVHAFLGGENIVESITYIFTKMTIALAAI